MILIFVLLIRIRISVSYTHLDVYKRQDTSYRQQRQRQNDSRQATEMCIRDRSLHCWQTDDVTGFENPDGQLSGGIQATGNYPGKARNIEEVRKDIEKVKSLLPGNHRLNIHAIYGDFGGQKVDRDQIEPKHFQMCIRDSEYTDLVEPIAFDEAFLDVTRNKKGIPLAVDVARAVKRQIRDELGLVASAGVCLLYTSTVRARYRRRSRRSPPAARDI